MYKKALLNINKLYEQDFSKSEQSSKIFELLKEVINFDDCAIFYLVPNLLRTESQSGERFSAEYAINDKLTQILYNRKIENISAEIKKLLNTKKEVLTSRLAVKGVVLGIICAERASVEFTAEEEFIFNTYASVISNIIKDIELSKILTQHTKMLEKGLAETHSAYETIKQQNKKIKKNEKLQNQFIANVSHDLRTPLNSIICLSETLSTQIFGQLTPKQLEYVEDIRISGTNLLGMINEVLDITKLEAHAVKLNVTRVDVAILINEVCNILKPLFTKKNLELNLKIPQRITISGDYIKLQQVLFNILGNAIKFSPENSSIEITAVKTGKTVDISIKDHGIGISKSNQKKIFKKFYQVENTLSKSGISTGLGLTIAKEFVKLHGGKITVESELHQGTTFTVTLPE